MAGEKEKVVRGMYDAFNCRDLDAALEFFHPDVEVTSLILEAEGEVFRGRDGIQVFWNRILTVFPDFQLTIEEVEELPDGVIVRGRPQARGEASGVPATMNTWAAGHFEDGLIHRGGFFRTRDEVVAFADART